MAMASNLIETCQENFMNFNDNLNPYQDEMNEEKELVQELEPDQDAFIDEKWLRLAEWVHCVCIVTFDLELGQAMEVVYPPHIKLSEQEKTNICYLAFPDSNSGCMGNTQFHIRLRVAPGTHDTLLSPTHNRFNSQCVPVQRADPGHYWGFVYFRQIKDPSIPRGYFQKSFIILTRLPFFNLFNEICSLMAPRFFNEGLPSLKLACDNICKWPRLRAGDSYSFYILDTVFQTVLPKAINKTHNSSNNNNNSITNSPLNNVNTSNNSSARNNEANKQIVLGSKLQNTPLPTQVLTSVHEIDIFRSLSSVVTHIHMLWELVLTAEPIVVMGTSPTSCSHMVQSLVSLIAPLAYCAESRPYFTIHDSEFKEFTQRTQGPPSVIIGVTNPFFTKPLQNWPHTIRLGEPHADLHPQHQPSNLIHSSIIGFGNISQNHVAPAKFRKVKSFNSKILDYSPGVYTKYKPFLQKDKTVIKKILHGMEKKRPASVQSALLRRYLLELTQSFMIPLERYMASLMPLQKDISPFKAAPNPNQFKQDDFLATLEQSGPQLTSPLKGDWEGLYKRFFRSPNFKGWYENRDMELRQTLQALQLQALSNADLNKWVEGKHEVEIVDMILKLKQKLKMHSDVCDSSQAGHPCAANILKPTTRNQLLQQLENMKKSLPEDLKTLLNET